MSDSVSTFCRPDLISGLVGRSSRISHTLWDMIWALVSGKMCPSSFLPGRRKSIKVWICYNQIFPTCDLREGGHEAEQLAEVSWLEEEEHGYLVSPGPWREVSPELSEASH